MSADSWKKALDFTLEYEGGYANSPIDRGGETFRGVARKFWPDWEGWAIIDRVKAAHPADFRGVLLRDEDLKARVISFYRTNFWEEIHGDELPGKVAVAAFDMAGHSGSKRAARALQTALGVTVDGILGPKSIKAAFDRGEDGLEDFIVERQRFLIEIMLNDPTQRGWAKNWLKRCVRLCNLVLEGPGVEFGA